MEKIFEHANDLHVVATMVYNKTDEFAYKDAACTQKFTTSELKEAFIKGALIDVNGALYKAVSFSIASEVGTISYVTVASSAVTITGLKSVAD